MKIFAIYKPKGPSSYDIVRQIKRATGEKKVGHAGTLDPLAEGVLVIGIGREATKQLGAIADGEKEYLATIRLGAVSETDDAEGKITEIASPRESGARNDDRTSSVIASPPAVGEAISRIIKSFIGKIKQTPPAYSAIKINGQRAYKLARAGKKPRLKPRLVEIKNIKIISYKWPYLKIGVITGPGVYIRALARDIGQKVGTGGYLYALERVRVGKFKKKDAVRMSDL